MQKGISRSPSRAVQTILGSSLGSRIAGFTVIELMISLMLLAIAAALSLPSYRDMIEKRQLTHGAEQIMAFVNSAQLEATRQNDFVTISWSRTADNNWCFGTTLGADACDCTETTPTESDFCAVNAVPSVISNLNVGSRDLLKAISGDANYTYDPVRGIFNNPEEDLWVEMSSDSESYALTLRMNRAGHASICTNEDQKVPGYEICPLENEVAES